MSEKIRVVVDLCTPTRERRPITVDDVYDDIKVLEFNSKEELADELAQMSGYEDVEEFKEELADEGDDLDDYNLKGDELDKICQYLLGYMDDPGDGSPNIQYISINGKPAYEDYWMTYDSLSDNMDLLAHGSEEDIIKYYLEHDDYIPDEDDEDDEDDEELEEPAEHEDREIFGIFKETVKKLRQEGYIVDVASPSHIDQVFETKCYAIACAYTRERYNEIFYAVKPTYVGGVGYSEDFFEEKGCFGIFDSDSGNDYEICAGVELLPTHANTVDKLVKEIKDNVDSIEESFKSKDRYSVLREALDRVDREDNKRKKTKVRIKSLRSRLKA